MRTIKVYNHHMKSTQVSFLINNNNNNNKEILLLRWNSQNMGLAL